MAGSNKTDDTLEGFMKNLLILNADRHAPSTLEFYNRLKANTQGSKCFCLGEIAYDPRITSETLPVRHSKCDKFECVKLICTGGYESFSKPLSSMGSWDKHADTKMKQVYLKDAFIDTRLANLLARWQAFQDLDPKKGKTTNYLQSENTRVVYVDGQLFAIQNKPKELVVREYDRPQRCTLNFSEGPTASRVQLAKRIAENYRYYYAIKHRKGSPPEDALELEEALDRVDNKNEVQPCKSSKALAGSCFGKQGSFVVLDGWLYTDVGGEEFDSMRKSNQPADIRPDGSDSGLERDRLPKDIRAGFQVQPKPKPKATAQEAFQLSFCQMKQSPSTMDNVYPQQSIKLQSHSIRKLPIVFPFYDIKDLVNTSWVMLPADKESRHALLAVGGRFKNKYEQPSDSILKEQANTLLVPNAGILIFGFHSKDLWKQSLQQVSLIDCVNSDGMDTDSPAVTVMSYYKQPEQEDKQQKKRFDILQGNVYIVANIEGGKPGFNVIYEYDRRRPNQSALREVGKCANRTKHACTNHNGKLYIFSPESRDKNRLVEIFDPLTQQLSCVETASGLAGFDGIDTIVMTMLHPLSQGTLTNELVVFGRNIDLAENNYVLGLKYSGSKQQSGKWELFDGNSIRVYPDEREHQQLIITDTDGIHRQNSIEFMCLRVTTKQKGSLGRICRLIFSTDCPDRAVRYHWYLTH